MIEENGSLILNELCKAKKEFIEELSNYDFNIIILGDDLKFQEEVRKFEGYEEFEINRGLCKVLAKTICDKDVTMIFHKNILSLNPTLVNNYVLHEFSHVEFNRYKKIFNLSYAYENTINNNINNSILDVIEEYYAQRNSVEIIKYNKFQKKILMDNHNMDIKSLKNRKLEESELKFMSYFYGTIHGFGIVYKSKFDEINDFFNKLSEMYENKNFNLSLLTYYFLNLIE